MDQDRLIKVILKKNSLYMFSTSKALGINRSLYFIRRWKSKHALRQSKKVTSTDKALEHFDDFYKPIFGLNWPSIRLGLLCENKFIAALNNYSDVENTRGFLENEGAINISRLFDVEASRILEKINLRRKSNSNSKSLSNTISDISGKKATEEYNALYCNNEGIRDSDNTNANESTDNDRYIDPSVSLSQLHEYIPATELKGSEDWVPESTHYSYYSNTSDLNVKIVKESNLLIPENLHLYTFEPGNVTRFPRPKRGNTGVSAYYLMDGGSILPVLALDIKPDDEVLDLCAAPGGKSYLCLQTLYPKNIVCNDISESRLNRIRKVFKEFFYDFDKKINCGEIVVTGQDARYFDVSRSFNKILVDVPCTTDRHSVTEDDNNIFKSSRVKERIRLPELQSEILTSALKLASVGGTVVYSTCSLSPIQNDGVVHMALQKIAEETDSEFVVIDMKEALEPTRVLFRYANIGLKYGHLVVPHLLNNFGPMYFCKLVRMK